MRTTDVAAVGRVVNEKVLQDQGTPAAKRGATRLRTVVLPHYWLAIAALSMMVTSEYKLRTRSGTDNLAGRPDLQVLVEVATYVGIAICLAVSFGHAPRLRRAPAALSCLWLFVGSLAASAVWSPYPVFGAVRGMQLVVAAALAHTLARRGDSGDVHRFFHAYIIVVVGSVMFGLVKPYPRKHVQASRFTWLYVHPVTAGTYLALAVVILGAYLATRNSVRSGPRWHPILYTLMLAVCIGGLIGTQTRGAIGGAVAGTALVLVLNSRKSRRVDLLAFAAFIVAPVVLLAARPLLTYLARGEDAAKLASFNGRTSLWDQALAAFRVHPVLGWGISASRGIFLDATGLGGGHNAFINVVTDAGLLGVLSWSALLVAVVAAASRLGRLPATRRDSAMAASLVLALAVNSFTNEGLGAAANVSSITLFIIAGWLEAVRRTNGVVPGRVPLGLVTVTASAAFALGIALSIS